MLSRPMIPVLTLQAVAPPAAQTGPSSGAAVMHEAQFRALYTATARPLRAYLINACGDRTLADDLLQEAYYRFLRSGFQTDDAAYRKSYLFRIATNLLRDHHRRKKPLLGILPRSGSIAGHGDRIHLRSDMARAMARLGPRDRQMLWLAYVEGSSHREIAATLGLQPASIRSMLSRARQRLAEVLRERGLAPPSDEEAAP